MLGRGSFIRPPPFGPISDSLRPTTLADMSNISFALSMSPPSLDVLLLNASSRLSLSQ